MACPLRQCDATAYLSVPCFSDDRDNVFGGKIGVDTLDIQLRACHFSWTDCKAPTVTASDEHFT
jgi:hypothetical protein